MSTTHHQKAWHNSFHLVLWGHRSN